MEKPMKVKINKADDNTKVLFHLVRVDSVLEVCPECQSEVFKPKVERDNNGLVAYKTACVKCDYEQLDGTYVSTINDCGEACKIK
jgi:hypothetical protein